MKCIFQPMTKVVRSFKWEVESAAKQRQRREHHQWDGNGWFAFHCVSRGLVARLPKEDHPDLPSHVKCCKECRDTQKPVNDRIVQACIQQNFIFRPEPCKWDDTSQRKR